MKALFSLPVFSAHQDVVFSIVWCDILMLLDTVPVSQCTSSGKIVALQQPFSEPLRQRLFWSEGVQATNHEHLMAMVCVNGWL